MPEHDRKDDEFEVADPRSGRREAERDSRTGRSAAAARIAQQSSWVDLQVRQAMERGEFDYLPGRGKPIEDLGSEHDPDWWVKKLVERENIALLPPALAIRKEDAELDGRLDAINVESEVRREVEEFNARVRKAIYTPPVGPSGPPVITQQRDVDAEVVAWTERRTARIEAQRAARAAVRPEAPKRPWWRRRSGG
ncbi:DUF1992 domain-containing protein [Nocardioides hwasunensis]|uniref:DUF1992 domain-containing protein n=1 Tax=Nocardioides hwasunensis TaxID=397258 RepID=A0ABR8MR34_9ACTN|nr:DUF1992 domain-containing protein [Nocardioides hwasunensis]MBD3916564.1 DUF1992 domain-containing protein [Nocardioides hwasunensis]